MKSPIQLFIAIAILLATATAAAQVYKWVDKDGKVQYSDTPPPKDATKAEAKKIDAGAVAPGAAAPTLEKRAKDFDKRRNEEVEKGKKAAEAQKKADIDEENCKNAKIVIRDLESGRPLKRATEQGESKYITDEERQADLEKARATAAASCKA